MYPMSEGEYRTGLRTARLTELQIRSSTVEVRNGASKLIHFPLAESRTTIETIVISMSSGVDATGRNELLDFVKTADKRGTIPNRIALKLTLH